MLQLILHYLFLILQFYSYIGLFIHLFLYASVQVLHFESLLFVIIYSFNFINSDLSYLLLLNQLIYKVIQIFN